MAFPRLKRWQWCKPQCRGRAGKISSAPKRSLPCHETLRFLLAAAVRRDRKLARKTRTVEPVEPFLPFWMGGLKSAVSQITSIKITFSNDRQKEDFRAPSLGHPPERRHAMGYAHTSSTTFVAGSTGFRRAQWRMLFAAMLCYLFFYTGRQTFGFAIPGIQKEFGL